MIPPIDPVCNCRQVGYANHLHAHSCPMYGPFLKPGDPQEWFDMDKFAKSGQYIGPKHLDPAYKGLANLDIDAQPSPSMQEVTYEAWQLAVRGWGIVVITESGVRLLWRKDLGDGVVESFGPFFP